MIRIIEENENYCAAEALNYKTDKAPKKNIRNLNIGTVKNIILLKKRLEEFW